MVSRNRQLHDLSFASVVRFDAHLEIIPENEREAARGKDRKAKILDKISGEEKVD